MTLDVSKVNKSTVSPGVHREWVLGAIVHSEARAAKEFAAAAVTHEPLEEAHMLLSLGWAHANVAINTKATMDQEGLTATSSHTNATVQIGGLVSALEAAEAALASRAPDTVADVMAKHSLTEDEAIAVLAVRGES